MMDEMAMDETEIDAVKSSRVNPIQLGESAEAKRQSETKNAELRNPMGERTTNRGKTRESKIGYDEKAIQNFVTPEAPNVFPCVPHCPVQQARKPREEEVQGEGMEGGGKLDNKSERG